MKISMAIFKTGIPQHLSNKYDLTDLLRENREADCEVYPLYGDEFVAIEMVYTGKYYNRSIITKNRRVVYIFRDFVVAKLNKDTQGYIDVSRADENIIASLIKY